MTTVINVINKLLNTSEIGSFLRVPPLSDRRPAVELSYTNLTHNKIRIYNLIPVVART